jgi:uncharacterized membrane protein
MAAPAIATRTAPAPRIQSVDALRGAIMMLMAIDHIRDFIARSAMEFLPTDLTRTTPAIFFTRWITHFCAPVFMLTAGLGAFFWMTRGHHSRLQLSRFLISRGLWLILLEVTIFRLLLLSALSYRGEVVILMILWAIGCSMIALAALIYLPVRVLAALSIAIIALHNRLDPIKADRGQFAWLWEILHQQGLFTFAGIHFVVAYPILPWIGVVALGYCLGQVFSRDADRRRRFLTRAGIAISAMFLLVRAVNIYGDPGRWTHQSSQLFTVLSFLNTSKYPPSLDFLLMTLGPALFAMSWLERFHFAPTNPLVVFGRVPFFFYVAHLALAHVIAVVMNLARYGWQHFLLLAPPSMSGPSSLFPSNYGYPLWVVYAVWIVLLVLLYAPCLWFSRLKQRRHDWWLSYL